MKKHLILTAILVLLLSVASVAAPALKADTNLAAGRAAYGTFSYAPFVTDGKIGGISAVSGDLADSPQYLTIDLGMNMYLDRVKVYWDKDALSNGFTVRTSADTKYWQEEARNIDASFGALDRNTNTVAVTISLKRAVISSRYLQIVVPAGSKFTNAKGNYVRITEVEVFPSVNQNFAITAADAYVVTGNSAIIKYSTSIGAASGTVVYGTEQNKLSNIARNAESGADNSVVLTGLKSRTTYFYEIRTTDYYGKSITSNIKSFTTIGDNVALKKKATGTFIYYPADDTYVKPGNASEILARVDDGSTGYFTSMAMSGPISGGDQYVVIDLGRQFNIRSIVSNWRRLAYPQSLTIQVSDDGASWKTVADGLDAGKGAFARSETGDPMAVLNAKGQPGRYVKLLIRKGSAFYTKHTGWDFVQLMDVEVYAE